MGTSGEVDVSDHAGRQIVLISRSGSRSLIPKVQTGTARLAIQQQTVIKSTLDPVTWIRCAVRRSAPQVPFQRAE